MATLIGYHGSKCSDGFMGAAIAIKSCIDNNIDYDTLPLTYTDESEQKFLSRSVFYDRIVIVDYCLSLEITNQLLQSLTPSQHLVVLDHHISRRSIMQKIINFDSPNVFALYSDERSGAGLAWDYFFSDKRIPPAVALIEDRDLWKFKFGLKSRAMHLYLKQQKEPLQFCVDMLDCYQLHSTLGFQNAMTTVNYEESMISSILETNVRLSAFNNVHVAMINCPSQLASQAANNYLDASDTVDLVICYNVQSNMLVACSVRSSEGASIHAVDLATKLGGGGHTRAAGCSMTISELDTCIKSDIDWIITNRHNA